MIYEQKQPLKRVGWVSGYIVAYLLFTTVPFFMLTFLKKLPGSWSYFHMAGITALVAIVALTVKRLLK